MALLETPNPTTAFPVRCTSASVTSLASLDTSATALAVNTSRLGVIIHNTDANAVFIKYGATATASLDGYTYKIPADATWEMPNPIYTGIIDAIWAANGSGGIEITELS